MKFPYRIQRQALGTTAPVRAENPRKPGPFAGKDKRAEYESEVQSISDQYKADVNAYAAQELNNRKVARRESLPGAQSKLGQSTYGKRVGDAVTDLLMDSTPQAIGYGSAGLGLAAMGLADPLNVYSEGGLFQQDPMAQARYKAARSMELAGTPGVAKAIFEDQINNTLPSAGAFIRDSDAAPTELQLPRDSDYPGMGGVGYGGSAHYQAIDVAAIVDQRAQQLMQTPYETADGTLAVMSYPTAINRAQEEVNLELRANGII
jgi:hypothetical protein